MSSFTIFIIFVCIIAALFLAINLLLAPHNPYQEKISSFECGFHSFLQTRSPFSIQFFIYGLLFLLFDLEILLIYPYVVSSYVNGVYGLIIMLIFTVAITIGFIFELGKQALRLSSKQNSLKKISNNIIISYIGKGFGFNSTLRGSQKKRMFSTSSMFSFKSSDPSDLNDKTDFTPVIIYSNSDTSKAIILSDNKGKSGVYR